MFDIPFAKPFIRREEEEAVLRVLRSGWITTGAETLAFEKEFAEFLNARSPTQNSALPVKTLAVNSATAGLHLALEACAVQAGDVVLVPTYTFASTAEAARYLGAEVAFVDCAPGSFLFDIDAAAGTLERLLRGESAYANGKGPRGKAAAIMPVHFGGAVCDMTRVMELAKKYNVKVVEDAAHAFPAYDAAGRPAGTISDVGVFSFYATKTITTGEGGMAVSRDERLLTRMQTMRLHGIDRPVWNRYSSAAASWYYEIRDAGFKYNLTDIASAIGREQLKRADTLLGERKKIAARYDAAFGKMPLSFALPPTAPGDARHLYPLRVGGNRDELIQKLKEAGIGASVHFIPLHTMPYYKKRYGIVPEDFPNAYSIFKQEISLPIWPGMTDEMVEYVIGKIL
jgi:dTDP-4-amino-4,6-dideoxygalactose transaminase